MTRDEPEPEERLVEPSLVRLEQDLLVDAEPYVAGAVRVRKHVERVQAVEPHERRVEFGDVVERAAPDPDDSGAIEQLPDGAVSVPVFAEEIVVSKRLVLRERVVIRKAVVTEHARLEGERAVERVDVAAEDVPEM